MKYTKNELNMILTSREIDKALGLYVETEK
jgi:hypothetical protein